MSTLKWILIVAAAGYVSLLTLLYVAQRALMYFPDTVRAAPADVGFPQAQEAILDTADGARIVVWHVPPREGKPVILYFHGNGGALRHRAPKYRLLTADGTGLVALSYRGYGGSTGSPNEEGLFADARAAYDFAAARYPLSRKVIWGESLGTGVAVELATEKKVDGLILEAPYTSTVDIAAAIYPIFPVRLLMKDQFRSDERIGKVSAPLLVLHGALDRVVPIAYGEKLFSLAREPKKFVRFVRGAHEDLSDYGSVEAAREFLNGLPAK
jgi:fermentation-respiration switch protein FrsA (DUF1100 family)